MPEINIKLSVFGDSFSPKYLTELIKIDPTEYWSAGDIILPPRGVHKLGHNVSVRKYAYWEFATGYIETLHFEDVALILENKLINILPILKSFMEENKLEAALYVVVRNLKKEEMPSIHLSNKILSISENLNAEIDIDLYE